MTDDTLTLFLYVFNLFVSYLGHTQINMIPIDVIKELDDSEIAIIGDESKLGDVEDSPKELDSEFFPTAVKALAKFLELCRFRTGDVSIRYRDAAGHYSRAFYIDGEPISTRVNLSVGTVDIPPYIDGDAFGLISHDLALGHEVPLSRNLILDSRSLLKPATRRSAVINAVTALEAGLSGFLRNYMRTHRVDNNTFFAAMYKLWSREESMALRVGMAVRLLPGNVRSEIKAKGLQKKCGDAIELRHRVVHQGRDISEDQIGQIRQYIEAIEEMLDYLDNQTFS